MSSSKEDRPIIVIALLTAACLVGDSMLYVVLPTHWQEAGLISLWEVGILLSANRLVRLPLNPLVGWLYSKISTRCGVISATLLAFLTTLAYGTVQGFWPLLIIRCIWGVAWTFLRLGAYFTILDYAKDSNRGHSMGLYNGLYRLGSLVGMLAGGLLADAVGLKLTAYIFAGITFLAIPLAVSFIPANAGVAKITETQKPTFRTLLEAKNVVTVLLSGLLLAMIYQGMFTSTLSYLIAIHMKADLSLFNFTLGAASLAGFIQAIRWGWEPYLAPWFGRRSDGSRGRLPLFIGTLFIAGILLLCIAVPFPLWIWLSLLFAVQITATALTTIVDALASDVATNTSKAYFMTAYSLAIDLGAAIGPMASYFLTLQADAHTPYWSAGLVLLLMALSWYLTYSRRLVHQS